jgi:hypothetical protein
MSSIDLRRYAVIPAVSAAELRAEAIACPPGPICSSQDVVDDGCAHAY